LDLKTIIIISKCENLKFLLNKLKIHTHFLTQPWVYDGDYPHAGHLQKIIKMFLYPKPNLMGEK